MIICQQNRKNQELSYNNIACYVDDLFLGLGAENIMIETFKGNYKILCRASKLLPQFGNKSIIRISLEMVERFSREKNPDYWQKVLKLMEFLFVLIFDGETSIDINQRIISEEFFMQHMFVRIFFQMRIVNHRIKFEQEPSVFVEIERIRQPILTNVME